MIHQNIVIGSGPSGFSAVMGLLKTGAQCTLIDIGFTTEVVSKDLNNRNYQAAAKKKFNSAHMWDYPTELGINVSEFPNVIDLSGGFGGLSTVWGTGIQPPPPQLLNLLPLEIKLEIEKGVKEILEIIPTTCGEDGLMEKFPWPQNILKNKPIIVSDILKKVSDSKTISLTKEKKFIFGYPRLAINAPGKLKGCVKCGNCLTGCEYDSLFETTRIINDLISQNKITYIQGAVEKINKTVNAWEISFIDTSRREQKKVLGHHIYLATGPVGTPMILQKSKLIDNKVEIFDSQVFYQLYIGRKSKIKSERFSLGQSIVTTDNETSELQDFYMSLYEDPIALSQKYIEQLPVVFNLKPISYLVKVLSKFLRPGIGFIEQSNSGTMILNYNEKLNKHFINFTTNNLTKSTIKNYTKQIAIILKRFGLIRIPLPYFFESQGVGSGFHSGASIPMSDDNSKKNRCNWNGEFVENLYLVDSTSLPIIIPGAHTLGVMANSYRIAKKTAFR
jgi:hypothetical protein